MNDGIVLARLRQFLFLLSGGLLVGTLFELWLTEHAETFVQLIPHLLCAAGLAAIVVALLRPGRGTVWGLRLLMSLVWAGALYGVYQHVWNNALFEREINPNVSAMELVMSALGGANPLLAPGVIAIAAMLALAASYHHPALGRGDE